MSSPVSFKSPMFRYGVLLWISLTLYLLLFRVPEAGFLAPVVYLAGVIGLIGLRSVIGLRETRQLQGALAAGGVLLAFVAMQREDLGPETISLIAATVAGGILATIHGKLTVFGKFVGYGAVVLWLWFAYLAPRFIPSFAGWRTDPGATMALFGGVCVASALYCALMLVLFSARMASKARSRL